MNIFDIYSEIIKLRQRGEEAALATVVQTRGSCPGQVGAKMIVKGDGTAIGTVGGGCIDAQVRMEAAKVIKDGSARTITITLSEGEVDPESGLICGGQADIFIESLKLPSLYIFGAGHIGALVCKIAKIVGFSVAVFDDRAEYANHQRLPEADKIIVESFNSLDRLEIPKEAYLVIVTRGHKYDEAVLAWALKKEAKYIGMIGSRSKISTTYENLRAQGISQERLNFVHAPIGLDIGSRTPEEIAISIVAELIKIRRGKA
jgi:xanthine dehydrogenase accessory factor